MSRLNLTISCRNLFSYSTRISEYCVSKIGLGICKLLQNQGRFGNVSVEYLYPVCFILICI